MTIETIHKAYKFRLKPSEEQLKKLYQMAGCGRVVYNDSLDYFLSVLKKETGISDKKKLYEHLNDVAPKERRGLKKNLSSAFSLNKLLTGWKKKPDRLWLDSAFSACLQQRQADLVKAVKDWASGKRGFPKFRQRKIAHHSTMRFPSFSTQCEIDNRKIKLTGKLGFVGFYKSQDIEGKPKSATVTLNAQGQWHVSILCEVENKLPNYVEGGQVGIDMGIAKNITCSNEVCGDRGVFVGVHSYRSFEKKLATEQRKLSRKEKGSSNWKKQKQKINKIHGRIANIRRDYQQKTTTEISKNHAMVVCELLKVRNMSKSAKGTEEKHGKNVAAKSGLNKSILDEGWHEIRRQLEYKMAWKGGVFATVNPRNTSRECNRCGHTEKGNRTSQANFECVACSHSENADKNAAKNILLRYLKELDESITGLDLARSACEVSRVIGQQQETVDWSNSVQLALI
ncbi:hypothetical protein AB832_07385 [Flavobacteriaceae bacterium (ex Bugula neritina AB1)]|nr:hypothetical protein AB832_07385 [Flavobacteriaceae bacterium (ex Bugula neritina AB1)]